jgi:hypothetical protein
VTSLTNYLVNYPLKQVVNFILVLVKFQNVWDPSAFLFYLIFLNYVMINSQLQYYKNVNEKKIVTKLYDYKNIVKNLHTQGN